MQMSKLNMYFLDEIRAYKLHSWAFKKFNIVTHQNALQQKNNFDCGIHVINFIEQRDLNRY